MKTKEDKICLVNTLSLATLLYLGIFKDYIWFYSFSIPPKMFMGKMNFIVALPSGALLHFLVIFFTFILFILSLFRLFVPAVRNKYKGSILILNGLILWMMYSLPWGYSFEFNLGIGVMMGLWTLNFLISLPYLKDIVQEEYWRE